jgi:hypothetical protein
MSVECITGNKFEFLSFPVVCSAEITAVFYSTFGFFFQKKNASMKSADELPGPHKFPPAFHPSSAGNLARSDFTALKR